MKGHGEQLTRKQDQAIAALLSCRTIVRAAAEAGVSEKTLRTWLDLPAFQDAYRAARRRVLEHAVARIQKATGRAVSTLVRLLKGRGKEAPTAARAAIALLDQAMRGAELLDLVQEVEELKAELARRKAS